MIDKLRILAAAGFTVFIATIGLATGPAKANVIFSENFGTSGSGFAGLPSGWNFSGGYGLVASTVSGAGDALELQYNFLYTGQAGTPAPYIALSSATTTAISAVSGSSYALTLDGATYGHGDIPDYGQGQVIDVFATASPPGLPMSNPPPSTGFIGQIRTQWPPDSCFCASPWVNFTIDFSAPSSSFYLTFLDVTYITPGYVNGGFAYAVLDNVSVTGAAPATGTPAPASLALLSLGLFGIGGLRQKKIRLGNISVRHSF